VRGEFPNPGNMLRPGQYARIRAVTELRKGALLIPQQAVSDGFKRSCANSRRG
jgi:multidrug efflux pump subunit AcrA (membrane-fusion protein)